MKKLQILFILHLFFYSSFVCAQKWTYIGGSPGFSHAMITGVSSTSNSKGVPYVATKINNEIGFTVMKYDSSKWNTVGPDLNISNLMANGVCTMKFGNDGLTPYVVGNFEPDGSNSFLLSVYKYNGLSWEKLGSGSPLTTRQALYFDLKFSPNDVPYVTYLDYNDGAETIYVKKFQNGEWVSAVDSIVVDNVSSLSFSMFQENDFMLCYISKSATDAIFTKAYYNGTKWSINYGLSYTSSSKCVVSKDGTYYYGWGNVGSANKSVSVFKMKNGEETDLSSGIVTGDIPMYFDLKLSPGDVPYIAFKDGLDALLRVYCYYFQWFELPNTSAYGSNCLSLNVDSRNKVILAYDDNNDYYWKRLSAKSIDYEDPTSGLQNNFSISSRIHFNKSKDALFFYPPEGVTIHEIRILNGAGELLASKKYNAADSNYSISLTTDRLGVKLALLRTNKGIRVVKLF